MILKLYIEYGSLPGLIKEEIENKLDNVGNGYAFDHDVVKKGEWSLYPLLNEHLLKENVNVGQGTIIHIKW